MALPAVTVVIPTRDRAPMLRQALHSVFQQDVDLEVIVVDEASTDGTAALLATYEDPRLRVIHHRQPLGAAGARNVGIARARADVIAFLDDDDLWLEGKLRAQLESMERCGAEWAYGGAIVFSDGPRLEAIVEPPPAPTTMSGVAYVNTVPGGGSNAVVTRRALDAVGGLSNDLAGVEDWDLWIRLSQLGPPVVVNRFVVAYRRHDGNTSRAIEQTLASASELDRRYRSLRGGEPIDWADLLHWTSSDALRAGDHRLARKIALEACRQRHPAGLKRLLQSFNPMQRRPPIAEPREPSNVYERIRPPRLVRWPPGLERQLQDLLEPAEAQ